MTHDPICPFAEWPDEACYQQDAGVSICSVIAKAREDEAELHGYRLHDPAYAKGYAAALRSYQRFLEKVDTSGDCWMWLGCDIGRRFGVTSRTRRGHAGAHHEDAGLGSVRGDPGVPGADAAGGLGAGSGERHPPASRRLHRLAVPLGRTRRTTGGVTRIL